MYEKCHICGEYGFTRSHRCPPAWLAYLPEYGETDEDAHRVYATTAQDAAQEEARHRYYALEYPHHLVLMVRPAGDDDAPWETYEVDVELVPEFTARKARSHEAARAPESAPQL